MKVGQETIALRLRLMENNTKILKTSLKFIKWQIWFAGCIFICHFFISLIRIRFLQKREWKHDLYSFLSRAEFR